MSIIVVTQRIKEVGVTATQTIKQVVVSANTLGNKRGLSAYQIAVANGYPGTETEWVNEVLGKRWVDYVFGYKTKTKLPNLSNGKLIKYTFETASADVELWRFKAFDKSIDGFYTDSELTELVIKKRIKL